MGGGRWAESILQNVGGTQFGVHARLGKDRQRYMCLLGSIMHACSRGKPKS